LTSGGFARHGRALPEIDDRDVMSDYPGLKAVFSFADALALKTCMQKKW
jgi:hypothetical protein